MQVVKVQKSVGVKLKMIFYYMIKDDKSHADNIMISIIQFF